MEHEINILVVEPGRPPRPARVDYSLETFSQLVGGDLAMGCFLPQRVMLLYNEEANRQGLPPNRCNPFVNECISGTFLLCGLSDGERASAPFLLPSKPSFSAFSPAPASL